MVSIKWSLIHNVQEAPWALGLCTDVAIQYLLRCALPEHGFSFAMLVIPIPLGA